MTNGYVCYTFIILLTWSHYLIRPFHCCSKKKEQKPYFFSHSCWARCRKINSNYCVRTYRMCQKYLNTFKIAIWALGWLVFKMFCKLEMCVGCSDELLTNVRIDLVTYLSSILLFATKLLFLISPLTAFRPNKRSAELGGQS